MIFLKHFNSSFMEYADQLKTCCYFLHCTLTRNNAVFSEANIGGNFYEKKYMFYRFINSGHKFINK